MLGSITNAQVAERPRNNTQFAMRPHPTLPGTFICVKVDDLPAAERAKHPWPSLRGHPLKQHPAPPRHPGTAPQQAR
jgi:hypothetical protein